jgi:hypothetical protein
MVTHTFTRVDDQGHTMTWEWRGTNPIDALLRQWATCLPNTVLVGPLKCATDGHIYHLRLDEHGARVVSVVAVPSQFEVTSI